MMLNRIASYTFLGSLFGLIIVWGYLPRLWLMGWPQWVLLALAAVSLVLWMVFSLDRIRLWLKRRSTQFGIALVVTAVMALLILGSVNWAAVVYNKKFDITRNKMHTLSDQTTKVLGGLKEAVTVTVWTRSLEQMSQNLDMRKFFENYRLAGGGKLKVDVKDPVNDAGGAARDKVTRNNLIIVRSASGREARVDSFTDTKGEEQVTNAIIKAVKGTTKKTLCFLSGHGEFSLNDTEAEGLSYIKQRLTDSAYDAKDVALATVDKMPPECEAVVLVGPKGEPAERETKTLQTYLAGGGKMLALLGPGTPAGWRKLVAAYGAQIRSDLIIDPRVNPPIAVATNNFANDVDIVKNFRGMVLFPEVSSIQVSGAPAGAQVKPFVSSASYTFAKSGDLRNLRSINPSGADLRGPLPVAVLITQEVKPGAAASTATPAKPAARPKPAAPAPGGAAAPAPSAPAAPPAAPAAPASPSAHNDQSWWPALVSEAHAQEDHDHSEHEGLPPGLGGPPPAEPAKDGPKDLKNETTLVVVSNHTFVMNSFVTQMGNMDLFLNSVNYLLKDQDLIGIRPREIRQASLQLTNESLRQVIATIFLIAGLFLVGGIRASRRKSVVD